MEQLKLEDLLDQPIAYQRVFAFFVGVTGAVFLSQALYWSKRTSDKDGWFYKTREEWRDETGLSRWEQETARKKCIKKGFLEEKLAGNPARLYYKISLEPILKNLSMAESHQQDGGNPTNKKVGKPPTIYTENTTETTIIRKKPIVKENLLDIKESDDFNEWKKAKKERKQKKGGVFPQRSGYSKPSSPYQEKKSGFKVKKPLDATGVV